MIMTLSEVKQQVDILAAKIGAPERLLPEYGSASMEAQPFIEIDANGQLYLLANERGKEIFRHIALNMDDLLYQVFSSITQAMAVKYELANRINGQYSRKVWFVEQERLLGILNAEWKLKMHNRHQQLLKGN